MAVRLRERAERFCLEYVKTLNATQSAITAGYSPKTAVFIASENLNKPNIQARIAELKAKLDAKNQTLEAKTILSIQQRRELLSNFATETIEGKHGIVRDGNIRAIAELNKMDNLYQTGNTVNIDNRKIIIEVIEDGNSDRTALQSPPETDC